MILSTSVGWFVINWVFLRCGPKIVHQVVCVCFFNSTYHGPRWQQPHFVVFYISIEQLVVCWCYFCINDCLIYWFGDKLSFINNNVHNVDRRFRIIQTYHSTQPQFKYKFIELILSHTFMNTYISFKMRWIIVFHDAFCTGLCVIFFWDFWNQLLIFRYKCYFYILVSGVVFSYCD